MGTEPQSPKHLEDWLRDAHAMEKQAEKMLEAQASRLEHYPQLKARIEQHLTETRGQTERLEQCIALLGSDLSAVKDLGGKLAAFGQGMSGMMAGDEVVKGAMASYAFEHFEISSYKVLIQAANKVGKPEIARICEEILKEEEAMAEWLGNHLDEVTQQFLERSEDSDLRAKT
ncbi:ferritin-like domain-containing protein [Billgrantia desiderata]|uniref:Ferritin-like domain-containing protein n=1 Tax=Billgrantia desiderata TaxID=52021 RepID=A0AAW4YPK3_9GAMM|nr:ferritin-like domain-containing protein [Halomonas desiderata]MCE8013603.1 ferritin-like domain-containing protein [Halomonas desiderata]MCE8028369.1 ferritin-like domain-containing protein [Halomonas desiderata]MCE8044807.1 ferritin-like domain-containing protein [Halomonas desiderata]MCE8049415.1 ferritin-like domain-containing protein [Halomonas desiderata]MCE8050219.1 ferritin-like domain-containing protein [Halomonas desiderata]